MTTITISMSVMPFFNIPAIRLQKYASFLQQRNPTKIHFHHANNAPISTLCAHHHSPYPLFSLVFFALSLFFFFLTPPICCANTAPCYAYLLRKYGFFELRLFATQIRLRATPICCANTAPCYAYWACAQYGYAARLFATQIRRAVAVLATGKHRNARDRQHR